MPRLHDLTDNKDDEQHANDNGLLELQSEPKSAILLQNTEPQGRDYNARQISQPGRNHDHERPD